MTKKRQNKRLATIILSFVVAAGIFVLYNFLGPIINKPEKDFLFIKTGTDITGLKTQLANENILKNQTWFDYATNILGYKKVKPGKYKINNGMSIISFVRMLRNGQQTPVEFVVTKIRTKEQLAARISKAFECDSIAAITFLSSNDSLQPYGLDSNTVMTAVLPLTYQAKWNTTPRYVFDKFYDAYKEYWTDERKQKAGAKNLSITQVVTLASIIDEETNTLKEKGNIASVYMNRMSKGMPLQADPTVKFALKDFGIKRILHKHLEVISPYNTYRNKGLPPGPICTPMQETVEAVLNAPQTDYIYFVANKAFDGTHVFTTNYADHMRYAKEYQAELNKRFGNNKQAATQ